MLGGLLALGLAVTLRSAAEPVVPRPAAVPSPAVPSPDAFAAVARPYDRLPGRTPIPQPSPAEDGRVLSGGLPAVGPAGQRAAVTSAQLVLGRYCRRPARYAVTLDPERGWRQLRALAIRIDRSTDPPWVVVELTWTGRAYSWRGQRVQLYNC